VREDLSIVIPDATGAKPRESQHVAESAGSGQSTAGQAGTKAQKASSRTVKSDKEEPGAAVESNSDRPREKIRFVPVPRGPFSAGRVSAQGASSKSDSRKPAAPSDDSLQESE
jgi:hypothetical protein